MKNFLATSLGQFENTKSSYLKSENTGDCICSEKLLMLLENNIKRTSAGFLWQLMKK